MSVSGTVAVTGATGFVGRQAVRELLGRGFGVRGLVRDPGKAAEALGTHERLELVCGDACDTKALGELLAGCAAVVNTVGIIRESEGQTFQKLHVTAVGKLLEAMASAGCDRIVHVSALGVGEAAQTGYGRTKFEGERLIRSAGVRWTILRPGMIHGRDGELTNLMVEWARGRIAPFLFMPYFSRMKGGFPRPEFEAPLVQPIAVEDVARAIVESLEREVAVGEVYPLAGGETLEWPELLEFVRDNVTLAREGIKAVGIPGDLAAMKARGAGLLGVGALLPFDEGMAKMGAADSVSPATKAREHLELAPAGFRETAAGYLGGM